MRWKHNSMPTSLSACLSACLLACLAFVPLSSALADPCGMLPQSFVRGPQIRRIGVQQTYVFFRNGVESIVIRPGYSGSVDEFGMLVPLPSPPALRKVPDSVFPQIAAAIDPPEVVVQAGGFGGFGGMGGGFGGGGGGGGLGFVPPEARVRVIKEEAVGMYEVAVLEAGSAQALRTWMEEHKYRYPEGMDAACDEYVRQGWCFVAVKTKVKQKAASEPKPGQTSVDNSLPEGSTFDGHVQAMGFRFRVSHPVVPMRLSVHNPGDLRNIVYFLAEKPARIEQLPESFVVRQVSGTALLNNFRHPLPVRLIGGNRVPALLRLQVAGQRDPRPHNQVAADLFASDILASISGEMTHPHEQLEKQLLAVNESLGLRGPEIDRQVSQALQAEREKATQRGLGALRGMTLTVLDSDFPRDVLARHNLTFEPYIMPHRQNRRNVYDAIEMGPPPALGGNRVFGANWTSEPSSLALREAPRVQFAVAPLLAGGTLADREADAADSSPVAGLPRWSVLVSLLLGCVLIALVPRVRSRASQAAARGVASLLILASLTSALTAQFSEVPAMRVLVSRLEDPAQAPQAAAALMRLGEDAMPALLAQTRAPSLPRRGWAIVCLGKLEHTQARERLSELLRDETEPGLVRVWAGAALMQEDHPLPPGCVEVAKQFPALAELLARQP